MSHAVAAITNYQEYVRSRTADRSRSLVYDDNRLTRCQDDVGIVSAIEQTIQRSRHAY